MSRQVVKNIVETPEEKIKNLEDEKFQLQISLAETIEKQAQDKFELQLAMAELVESLNI